MNILPFFFNPLTFLVSLFLGLLVLQRNPKRSVNRIFASLAIFTAFWALSLLFYGYPIVLSSLAWLKIVYLLVFGIVYGIFYLSYVFPDEKKIPPKMLLLAYFLATAILSYLIVFTDLHIFQVVKTQVGWRTVVGVLYPLYPITLLFFSGIGFLNYARKVAQSRGLIRAQTLFLLTGLMIFSFLAVIFDVIVPLATGRTDLFILSPITSITFIAFTAYAIVKHRLMDIRFVVARSVAYSLLVAILSLIYASSMYIISSLVLPGPLGKNQLIVSTSLALIIALTANPLRTFLEQTTDRIFFKDRYDPNELLMKLTRIMAETIRLNDLTNLVLKEILGQIKISKGAILLFRASARKTSGASLLKDSKITWVKTMGYPIPPTFDEKEIDALLEKSIQNQEKILVFEELQEGKIKQVLRKIDMTMAVPLEVKGEKIGILLLGEKSSGDIFSSQDIRILEIISSEMAIALENARAYEEIKRFSITLEEEVKRATEELKTANLKLKELDQLKDEFLSIATHELRTPMTAIKGYLDMILSGDAGEINPKTKDFLGEASKVTDRLTTLVSDMLDVSRIEQKRITLEIKGLNLASAVKKVLEQLDPLAQEKKLSLSYKPFKHLPLVKADSTKVSQILNNLIGNAIKFTQKGRITVSHQVEDNFVVTKIKDRGIGIAKDDLEKLFQKFSKINGGLSRKSGTGLGLYISKGLVEAMKGKMRVETKPGQGSTFSFTLPKAKHTP